MKRKIVLIILVFLFNIVWVNAITEVNNFLDSYDLEDISEGTFIHNLISRKKQMLPKLMETLEKRV